MSNIRSKLIQTIDHKGAITVQEYMDYCLFDPEYGYYRTHTTPIGRAGDFTTAPEISQMFGEMIGLWVINLYEQFDEPNEIALVELGPGRGTLMSDLLRSIRLRPAMIKNLSIHLMEINPHLIALQKEHLKDYPLTWHDSLESLLKHCESKLTFVIANEFFDVLPLQQFIYQEQWFERLITYNHAQEEFCFCLAQQPTQFDNQLEKYPPPKAGDILEINSQATRIYQDFMTFFSRNKGGMLIFDYGYSQPLYGDSLQAVKDHRFSDVFNNPGDSDLTAHVNFWQLHQQSLDSPTEAYVTTQGQFLLNNGIRIRAAQLAHGKSESVRQQILMDLDRLTSEKEMGQMFKVLEVYTR
jgi:NADH dehydrogenase [ubiquinone] 1 alpha subcomplex assembly factor 7